MKEKTSETNKKLEKEKEKQAKLEESKQAGDDPDNKDDNMSASKRQKTDDNDSMIEYVDENGKRRRAKRRSKNDLDGRDYKCSFCSKTYLSYPALYTHMKNKHSTGSDGQHLLLNSGRGRGRPKKNAGRVTTIDPESDDYFKTLDKGGGPTDPLFAFENIVMDFFSDDSFANRKKSDFPENVKSETPELKQDDLATINQTNPTKSLGQNYSKTSESFALQNSNEENKSQISQELKTEIENKRDQDNDNQDQGSNVNSNIQNEMNEDYKSDSFSKRKDDQKKISFKQFDFKVYNDPKDYPLYQVLSKKSLFDGETPALEKSENNDELEKEASDIPKDDMDVDEQNEEEQDVEMKEEPADEQPETNLEKLIADAKSDEIDNPSNKDNMSIAESELKYGKKRFDQVLEDYEQLTFEQKQKLTVDDVCGIYLRETSQKVNNKFYKTLLKFVILFRECSNEYGWQKIIETEKLLKDEKIKLGNDPSKLDFDSSNIDESNEIQSEQYKLPLLNIDLPCTSIPSTHKNALQQQQMMIIGDIAQKSREGRDEFARFNSAEHLPEVCNEFVTIFLEQREEYIDRGDAIDLTLNFCSWLYKKGHTCIKLAMKNYS